MWRLEMVWTGEKARWVGMETGAGLGLEQGWD